QFLDDRDRASLALLLPLAALHHNVSTPRSHLHVGARSQKRVAADLLSALHRFEQESVGLVCGDREKGGDRRQQMGGNRFHHRHQGGISGEPGKLLVVGTKHGWRHSEFSHYRQRLSDTQQERPVKSNKSSFGFLMPAVSRRPPGPPPRFLIGNL